MITAKQARDASDEVTTNVALSTGEKLIPPTPAVKKNGLKFGRPRQQSSTLPIHMDSTVLRLGGSFFKRGRQRQQSSTLPIHMDGADGCEDPYNGMMF